MTARSRRARPAPRHARVAARRAPRWPASWHAPRGRPATAHRTAAPAVAAGERDRRPQRPATRGLALVQDYKQRREGAVTLTGHGVFAVDPESSDVLWWWFDDFGHPPLTPARGRPADDGALLLEKATPRGRQRASFAASGELLIHRIEVAPAGATEFTPVVDATYRRR